MSFENEAICQMLTKKFIAAGSRRKAVHENKLLGAGTWSFLNDVAGQTELSRSVNWIKRGHRTKVLSSSEDDYVSASTTNGPIFERVAKCFA